MWAKRTNPFDCVKSRQKVGGVPRQTGRLTVPRHINRRTHFHGEGMGQFFQTQLILRKDFDHNIAARGWRSGRPSRKRLFGSRDGGIGIRLGPCLLYTSRCV